MKIMIVEDDSTISQSLEVILKQWNYETVRVEDFSQVDLIFQESQPDLILLDINLPVYNGYYWCQKIREKSHVPIMFISSRSDHMDQIMAMQMGGDDFVQKPFDLSVLVAKIQALLRRSYEFSENEQKLRVQDATLDLKAAQLTHEEQTIDLTRTELLILERLFSEAGDFVSREDLMEACWQGDQYIDDNTLSVNISRLRKKLDQVSMKDWLETRKNVGYRIQDVGK